MSVDAVSDRPDTQDMVVVHRLFRRELRLLPPLVDAVATGDQGRSQLLTAWIDEVLSLLHHHHEGEDELLWPLLLERSKPSTALVGRMAQQHAEIDLARASAEAMSETFAATAGAEERRSLVAALDRLSRAVFIHLDEEEAEVLPLARECLSVAEWDAIGERGRGLIPKERVFIVLGAVLEDASEFEREQILGHLPKPAAEAWHQFGVHAYAEHIRSIRRG